MTTWKKQHRWEDDIKMDFKKWNGTGLLSLRMGTCRGHTNAGMNLVVPYKAGNV